MNGFKLPPWLQKIGARGNALAHGVACLASSADDPLIAAIGWRTVHAVLSDQD